MPNLYPTFVPRWSQLWKYVTSPHPTSAIRLVSAAEIIIPGATSGARLEISSLTAGLRLVSVVEITPPRPPPQGLQ